MISTSSNNQSLFGRNVFASDGFGLWPTMRRQEPLQECFETLPVPTASKVPNRMAFLPFWLFEGNCPFQKYLAQEIEIPYKIQKRLTSS